MIIDEDILKDGIDEVLLAKLIEKHSLEQERYEKLYNYYIGKHAICERRRSSDNIANNKIVCNHAKYIVDIAKSYLVGNPVAYSCSDTILRRLKIVLPFRICRVWTRNLKRQ